MTYSLRFLPKKDIRAEAGPNAPYPNQLSDAYRAIRLTPPKQRAHVILDTDTFNEVDDQFALAYAMLAEDKILLEAVHAAPFLNDKARTPEDGMLKSHDEILKILDIIGNTPRDFVFKGATRWLTGNRIVENTPATEDLILRALGAEGYPLYVVSIGAPTNVAAAILLEPQIVEKIVVIWLGGQPHDWHTAREFNLAQDIDASRVLFDSGVPLLQIPCTNVAEQLRISIPALKEYLAGKSALGDYLCDIVCNYTTAPFCWSKVIWDISAIAWLVNHTWFDSTLVHAPTLNPDFSYSIHPNRHLMRVATHIQRDPVFIDLFTRINALGYK